MSVHWEWQSVGSSILYLSCLLLPCHHLLCGAAPLLCWLCSH